MNRNLDAYCRSISCDRSMWMDAMELPRSHTWLARMPVKKSSIFQGTPLYPVLVIVIEAMYADITE